jgi:3-dehydroquinate synthase
MLNFGHTFGHAIEAATGYDGSWLHGEAVAAGMVLAAKLSVRAAGLAAAESNRVRELIERAGLPGHAPVMDAERYLMLMSRDKKVEAGRMRFVLLEALGRGTLRSDVSREDIIAVLGDQRP